MFDLKEHFMDVVFEYRKLLFDGTLVTITLALSSLLWWVVGGLAGAFLMLSPSRGLQKIGNTYTTLVRGVPDLVLMMLLFYGGQQMINDFGYWTGWWD
ncbi:MAG: ABC transporter permease subunit, partial [Gammaproteobacteria bacterium]|nr:ABC transporter permease subunit [Gammaproteobacteria bacterium]